MPFNVADFNSSIAKSGVASTSHFEAMILGGPGSYTSGGGMSTTNVLSYFGLEEGMRFRIESLNMPGRNLTTLDQNYHGPTRAMPYRFTQQPVSMTVILSRDMREREIFMRWQDYFVGHYRANPNRNVMKGQFDTKYYQGGIGTIKILQYSIPLDEKVKSNNDTSGNNYTLQTEILLEEAFPMSVHDIAMAWGDEGYGKLQVEIRYHRSTELNHTFPYTSLFDMDKSNRR
jgi:hypothetical protein